MLSPVTCSTTSLEGPNFLASTTEMTIITTTIMMAKVTVTLDATLMTKSDDLMVVTTDSTLGLGAV